MSRKRSRSREEPTKQDYQSYFPSASVPLDVQRYDLSCDSAPLEWWYFNSHVRTSTGREFSVFSSFFRQRIEGKDVASAVISAVTDVQGRRYLCDSLFEQGVHERFAEMLSTAVLGRPRNDIENVIFSLVEKKRLPFPARVSTPRAVVESRNGRLFFDMNDSLLEVVDAVHSVPSSAGERPPGCSYHVAHKRMEVPASFDLYLTPQTAPVLHGETGVVNGLYYYYFPRCTVGGSITIDGETMSVTGEGWYDREFGGHQTENSANALDGWIWFSLQLSDGEYSLFSIEDRDTKMRKDHVAVYTNAKGPRTVSHAPVVTELEHWTSMTSFLSYPIKYEIVDDTIGLRATVTCTFQHQELLTMLVGGGAFYEGRVEVTGTLRGQKVDGRGYVERKLPIVASNVESTLRGISDVVRNRLQSSYPSSATDEWIREYVGGLNYVEGGTPPDRVCATLFAPVRSLIDRGGKSWRSLLLVSTMSALHREYYDSSKYIILPELLHVGTLIIDDIQDESTVRRGGHCVHLDVGVPIAINAGTATYFMALRLASIDQLSLQAQVKIYELYFDALRAGHAGQGLDIMGLHYLLPAAIETGDITEILKCLQGIHVYKTGGAAANIMRIGCIIAGASDAQVEAMGTLGKHVGLAFQIVDDALNLRGFEGDLKEVGEDIRDGKITYPILRGFQRLPRPQREYIGEVLREKTSDRTKIKSVIDLLDSVSAIDACMDEARDLIDDAWAVVDATLHDSLPKIYIRSFLTFLVERRR